MPSIANRSIFETGYLLAPEKRESRSYSSAVCENPTQETSPRMKRCRSRIVLSASTTRRDISRKSPASTGIVTFVSRRVMRVEEMRRPEFEAALALAAAAHGIHDVEPVLPALDHRWNQFRRILQVGIDQHDRVAARDIEPRRRRELVAEVAREPHDHDARIGRGLREQQLRRAVGAAVVDEHDLVGVDARRSVRCRAHAPHQFGDVALLVVQRSNDAQGRHARSFRLRQSLLRPHGQVSSLQASTVMV